MVSISVVIPAYNEQDSIGKCIANLEAQLSAGDEIIIVNNGSTDNTKQVAQRYSYVTVYDLPDEEIPTDDPRPIGYLRQYGTNQATNEIVASMDADTVPAQDWIGLIKENFENDPDLCAMWGVVTDKNGIPVRNLTGKYLTFIGGVSGCNTAFRKSVFDEMDKGYIGWPMFEDVALITRMSRMGKTVHNTDMVVMSDLQRQKYQSIPIVTTGVVGALVGAEIGGTSGNILASAGAGMAGTEVLYEGFTDTGVGLHHDQIGLIVSGASAFVSEKYDDFLLGAGIGMIVHHFLTEGLSMAPTELHSSTDIFIGTKQ